MIRRTLELANVSSTRGAGAVGRPRASRAQAPVVSALVATLFALLPACSFNASEGGPGGSRRDGGGSNFDFPIRTQDGFVNVGDVPGASDAAPCSQLLKAVARDFRGWPGPNGEPKHPDFQNGNQVQKGIAAEMLGADSKPVYGLPGPTPVSTGAAEFAQWYRDVPGVNERFEIDIPLTPHPTRPGTFVFDNDAFFPLDGRGFGNQDQSHNFGFTTELHFEFPYRGGEVFTFRGDDDLYLYVNGLLAMDLGGVHGAMTATVDLDQDAAKLGITRGNTYRMDIFHAERHTSRSTFHIETTLQCVTNIVIP